MRHAQECYSTYKNCNGHGNDVCQYVHGNVRPTCSTVLSMVLMVIIRYISAVLVWILTALVVLGSLGELPPCPVPALSPHACAARPRSSCRPLSFEDRR